jgi:hypothetical protein
MKPKDFSHLHTNIATIEDEEVFATPQMGIKKRLKAFGEAKAAAVKELKQLHDHKVVTPHKIKELTKLQHQEALEYLTFLNGFGKIKAHGCAHGWKQHVYMSKEDAMAPMVATESVFLMAVVHVLEGCKVAVADIPGAFMQADMDENLHMWIAGRMAEILLEIDPDMYGPCLSYL